MLLQKNKYLVISLFVLGVFFISTLKALAQNCAGSTSFTINPQPTGGGYAPGTVVTYCYTVGTFSQSGSNWFEGFSINLGPGWLPGSITPVSPPNNLSGQGQWVWVSNPFNLPGGNTGAPIGPGYFYDYNNNGITSDDFGDMGGGSWTMCFSVTVGNTAGASLSVGIAPIADGYGGSWTSSNCDGQTYNPVTPASIIVLGCGSLIPSVTSQVNVLCSGQSNGSFSVGTANGNPPFNFSFQGGPFNSTNSFSGLAAGTYTVIIQDANACTVPFPVTITQPANPLSVTQIFKNNVGCAGGSTGNYRIIGSGGTGPYTYSTDGVTYGPPNNGSSFQTNNLPIGTYNLFVMDASGCTATLAIVITQPLPLTGSITSQTNVSCSGAGTGSVTIAGADGTPNYTYSIGGPFALSGTFNGLAPGSYTVTIKDANNCSTTVPVTIVQPTNPTGSVVSQVNVDCFGNSTGSLTLDGASGATPYTFSIGGGPFGGAVINNLAAGTYTITVQEANGCTGTFSATITEPQAINFTIANQTNINCFGASTGAVTLSALNGTAPFTYSFGANTNTTGTFTGLSAGTAAFSVSDANGCTATLNATITQPATGIGSLIVVQNNVLCSGTSTGSFTLQGNNGNAPYSYTLNGTTNTTGTFSGLSAAIYNVTVTDATGCTYVQSVNLISPNALAASITNQTAVTCFGGNNGSVTVTASSGSNPYSYALGATTNATGVFNALAAGAYNVVVTDQNGCTFSQAVTIVQPAAALSSVIASQTNVACFAGNTGAVTVTASNGIAGYTYQLGAVNNTTGQFSSLTSGNYTVVVTDNNACTHNQSVTITQPAAALSGNVTSNTPVACFGNNTGQIQLTGVNGTAPYSYNLAGVTNTTGNYSNLLAGNYTVTITDNNACTFNQTFTITQPTAPLTASIASQTAVTCFNGANGTVTITANNGTPGYQYGVQGTTLTNAATITNLAAGNYVIVVQDANTCTVGVNVTITQPAVPVSATITAQTNILCFGASTGSLSASAANGTAPYTYTVGPNSNTTGNFTALSVGNFTVNVTDANGCIASVSATLTQPAAALSVNIPTSSNPVCNGFTNGSAAALATGGVAVTPYQYVWNTNPAQNTAAASNLSAGSYTVTVTDNNACTASATVVLTQPNFQLTTPTAYTICNGETINLESTSLDGAAPVSYAWTNQSTGIAAIGNPVPVTPTSNVNYTVIATDANGCITAATAIAIAVNPSPVAAFTQDIDEGCQTLCVTFAAAPTIAGSTYSWDFGDSQTAIGQAPVNCFKDFGLYTISMTAISPLGCKNTIQKTDEITVYQIPKAIFSAEPIETTMSNPTVNVTNLSLGAESYLWRFGDKKTSINFQPEHIYQEPGYYCIWLSVENTFGCVDSAKECITIKPSYTLFVPNSFTPNGDNLNDVFKPLAQSVVEYQMDIFNRWGLPVFTTRDINFGWDGGNEPQGAFNYVIEVKTNGGEQKIYTGSVTLYR